MEWLIQHRPPNKAVQLVSESVDTQEIGQSLQEKLIKFLDSIDDKMHLTIPKKDTSDASAGVNIIPDMKSRGVNATTSINDASIQTDKGNLRDSNDLTEFKNQLEQAISQCSLLRTEKQQLELTLSETKKKYDTKIQKMQKDKENEIKFYKLHLESTFPFKEERSPKLYDTVSLRNPLVNPVQERLYRIRQSAERAALISKHEEEQAALISECSATLRTKIESFNTEVNKAVEKNTEEVKRERNEFVRFACMELKNEYNDRIEKLLRRHQQKMVEVG